MRYEYMAKDGETIELDIPAAAATPVGDWIKRNGKDYQRIFSSGVHTATQGLGLRARQNGVVGHGLPFKNRMCQESQDKCDGFDGMGRPLFDSDQKASAWCDTDRKRAEKQGRTTTFQYATDGADPSDVCDANRKGEVIR